jgi:hypothetical protein
MRRARWLAAGLLLLAAAPARADVTAFVGATATPANRPVRGFALGMSLLVVGFEFEYSDSPEERIERSPSLRTGMGNAYLQTPFAVMGFQPYVTTGAGFYRERLDDRTETSLGVNSGAGVKISLLGPLRARIDYRVFRLRGSPLHATVHRTYAGVNVAF